MIESDHPRSTLAGLGTGQITKMHILAKLVLTSLLLSLLRQPAIPRSNRCPRASNGLHNMHPMDLAFWTPHRCPYDSEELSVLHRGPCNGVTSSLCVLGTVVSIGSETGWESRYVLAPSDLTPPLTVFPNVRAKLIEWVYPDEVCLV